MTDKTDSKEREALVAYLKDCDAHDIVPDVGGAWHAAFQAGRASLAASAGSEPVASIYITPAGEREMDDWKVKLPPGRNILYTHPSPPEGAGWRPIETAPKDGTPFLGWVFAERYGETDEGQQYAHDESQIDHCWWRTGGHGGYFDNACGQLADRQAITHWMPLPPPPTTSAGSEKGK